MIIDRAANHFIANCEVVQDGDTVIAQLTDSESTWWEGRATVELVQNISKRLVTDVCPGTKHVQLKGRSGHILTSERSLPTEEQRKAINKRLYEDQLK